MANNPATKVIDFGQSIWYDNISRDIIENGELKRLISEFGVRGLTSNPTIFDKAIASSSLYDQTISACGKQGLSTDLIFAELALADIGAAADLMRGIYDSSNGDDGFVSIEVSPLLAADTKGTIEEGLRLFKKLDRPNIMVKVPGTPDGIPAVRALLEEGVNINITLLFSVENYVEVARTYCDALRTRVRRGLPINKIRSVASFFVSRVDAAVDGKLDAIIKGSDPAKAEAAKGLRGALGVANSKVAYKHFQEIFMSPDFADLKALGAAPQRPLWASTGTKDPAMKDTRYVDELIGPHTVNTMPPATLMAFADHGTAKETILSGMDKAVTVVDELKKLGVDVPAILHELQVDGVKKFSESFDSLNASIKKKLPA